MLSYSVKRSSRTTATDTLDKSESRHMRFYWLIHEVVVLLSLVTLPQATIEVAGRHVRDLWWCR